MRGNPGKMEISRFDLLSRGSVCCARQQTTSYVMAEEYSYRQSLRARERHQHDCARHHCLHTLMDSRDSHAGLVDRHIVDCASQRCRAAGTPPSLLRSHRIPAPKASLMGWLSERASLKLLDAVALNYCGSTTPAK